MKIIADTHCHTIASTHAYSTITENVLEAKRKNLHAIAITDHSNKMPGSPGKWYFKNLKVIPNKLEDVNVLKGIEANVLNSDGDLDFPEELLEKFDLNWVIASIHKDIYSENHDFDSCTKAWLNVAKNPLVNVIGHSGLPNYEYDFEKVIPEFSKNGKLIEINNSSFTFSRAGSEKNCREIAKVCKKYGAKVIVNSDAHFYTQVGEVSNAIEMLQEIDFPEDLVVNASVETFENYLKEYTNFFN